MAATPRFHRLDEVADILNTSVPQVYALVRRGELIGVKIGGRGQWRVEKSQLEAYIAQAYRDTEQYVAQHPFADQDSLSINSD